MFDKVIEDMNIWGEDFDNYFLEKMRDEDTSATNKRQEARKKARMGKEVVHCRNNFSQQMLMDDVTDITGGWWWWWYAYLYMIFMYLMNRHRWTL
jgi:hypothetical protein